MSEVSIPISTIDTNKSFVVIEAHKQQPMTAGGFNRWVEEPFETMVSTNKITVSFLFGAAISYNVRIDWQVIEFY